MAERWSITGRQNVHASPPGGTALGETLGPNISLTARLADTVTTPMLLKVVRSGKLQPGKVATHRFALGDIMKAYDTFGNVAKEGAIKVVLANGGPC